MVRHLRNLHLQNRGFGHQQGIDDLLAGRTIALLDDRPKPTLGLSPKGRSVGGIQSITGTSVKTAPRRLSGSQIDNGSINIVGTMNDPPTDADKALRRRVPIVFGEVLFDCFRSGEQVLGGAPFNVAWNLQGLMTAPYFVSGVGKDDDAGRIRSAMSEWGMTLGGLQTIKDRPTGRVAVTMDQQQATYKIDLDQAYDYIAVPDLSAIDGEPGLIYHGSLVCRSPISRESLFGLITDSDLPRFVDINIRQPHFDAGWLKVLIGGARWIKINDEELQELAGIEVTGQDSIRSGIERLRDRYGGETYLVTCGAAGAYAMEDDQLIHVPAPAPSIMMDTVGAGDSFSAAMIAGILHEVPLGDSLEVASRLASRICGINGGTKADMELYQDLYN